MKFADIPVVVDPAMPTGTWELRSVPFISDAEARGMAAMMSQRAAADPAFAEDCESISESMPFFVETVKASRPIRCECCGTWVTMVPESRAVDMRSWKPAIWEAETGRKHTLRRCGWMREQHGQT